MKFVTTMALVVLLLGAAGCLKRVGGESPRETPAASAPQADAWPKVALRPGEKLIEVDEVTDSCPDTKDHRCLRIRFKPEQPWGRLLGRIDDFVWQPGYRWLLRVREPDVRNPELEHHWQLVEVVRSTLPGVDLPQGLEGTNWLLEDLVLEGETKVLVGGAGLQWVKIDLLTGTTGCNRFQAGLAPAGTGVAVNLGEIATAHGICPEAVAEQEKEVLEALRRVEKVKRTKRMLILSSMDDATVLRYRPAP